MDCSRSHGIGLTACASLSERRQRLGTETLETRSCLPALCIGSIFQSWLHSLSTDSPFPAHDQGSNASNLQCSGHRAAGLAMPRWRCESEAADSSSGCSSTASGPVAPKRARIAQGAPLPGYIEEEPVDDSVPLPRYVHQDDTLPHCNIPDTSPSTTTSSSEGSSCEAQAPLTANLSANVLLSASATGHSAEDSAAACAGTSRKRVRAVLTQNGSPCRCKQHCERKFRFAQLMQCCALFWALSKSAQDSVLWSMTAQPGMDPESDSNDDSESSSAPPPQRSSRRSWFLDGATPPLQRACQVKW